MDMIAKDRNITLEEKIFVRNFIEALKENNLSYFYNSLCRETQGFLKGIAAATGNEVLCLVEDCMEDIKKRCASILDDTDEIQSIGMAKGCSFVNIQDTLIFLVFENGECKIDYLREWEDNDNDWKFVESNMNFH